jgi:hypothetical protein
MLLRALWDSGVDTASANHAASGAPWVRRSPRIQNITIFVAFFGLDSALLTEGSILDPCYEMWE